jgi:spore coat polysaccharide biosynthesis protein SpsF
MNNIRILAVIQARMGSLRLPNKVLLPLAGKSVIEHVVERVRRCKLIDEVIVATSIDSNNLSLIKLCSENGIRIFIGSENDVLDRFYQLAKLIKPEHIVRITADCPLIDPSVISKVVSTHLNTGADYTSNTMIPTYPDGLDLSIFNYKALKESWKKSKLLSEREHVTPYIRKNCQIFKHINVQNNVDLSNKRWTLDEDEDYVLLQHIFNELYSNNPFFEMNDILNFLSKNTNLEKINSHFVRNEGYQKSLLNDKKID